MTLQLRLTAFRARYEAKAPHDALEIMHRATDDLRRSGILERVVQPGHPAPDFMLPDTDGRLVSTRDLRAHGPVVVTFYRGKW